MVYARDLLSLEFGKSGQNNFENWVKNGPVGGIEAFPWENWVDYFQELEQLAKLSGPFVLKTHKPFSELEKFLCNPNVKIIYSIRDPRDIVLSALDHGRRSRAMNDSVFTDCYDLETTISIVSNWCELAMPWINANGVEIFRYENLVQYPDIQVIRLANYLGISRSSESAQKVVIEERTSRQPIKNQFNKGMTERFSSEMADEDICRTENMLKKHIHAFGYSIYS